jgi:hypothetical protein
MRPEKTEEYNRKDQAEIQKKPIPRKGKNIGFCNPPFPNPIHEQEKKSSKDDYAHLREAPVELVKILERETGKEILDHTLQARIRLGIHVSHFPEKIFVELDEYIKNRCQSKTHHHIFAEEPLDPFDQEKGGITEPDTHPQLMD